MMRWRACELDTSEGSSCSSRLGRFVTSGSPFTSTMSPRAAGIETDLTCWAAAAAR